MKKSIVRRLSFVFGVLLTIVKLAAMSGVLAGEGRPLASINGVASPDIWFTNVWDLIATALIVWYAWALPQQGV